MSLKRKTKLNEDIARLEAKVAKRNGKGFSSERTSERLSRRVAEKQELKQKMKAKG